MTLRATWSVAMMMVATCFGLCPKAFGAPGDILFNDNFDSGPVACGGLAPNWTTTSATLADVGTFTSNSNSCALFTRGDSVTVTSVPIDLSSVPGAEFSAWVRKGSDAFSEDPDGVEDLAIEYLTATGIWVLLESFSASGLPDGEIVVFAEDLPFEALHSAVQFRIIQAEGTGGPPANGGIGFDFWHVDDVTITEIATAPPPPPIPDLTANSCDDFERGLINWTVSDTTRVGINTVTANSPSNSLFLRHGTASATSAIVDASSLTEISIWIRRGADFITGSEDPDTNEDLVFEYLNSSLVWVPLETFAGGGTEGEVIVRTYPATADFQHPNFRLRLSYLTGTGVDFDYWHVDDVCLVSDNPDISVAKSVEIESDPVSGAAGPYAVPGAFAIYTLTVTNNGAGGADLDSLTIRDDLDSNTTFFAGDFNGSGSPFLFDPAASGPASGISLDFTSLASTTDDIVFLNASNTPITPAADFDENVEAFILNLSGAFNGSSGTPPSFTVQYRVRVD